MSLSATLPVIYISYWPSSSRLSDWILNERPVFIMKSGRGEPSVSVTSYSRSNLQDGVYSNSAAVNVVGEKNMS